MVKVSCFTVQNLISTAAYKQAWTHSLHFCRLQRTLIEEQAAPSAAAPDPAQLAVMRLTHEEMSFRAVAVAGSCASASVADVQQAPLVQRQPPFSFIKPKTEQQWVVMPPWSAVMLAAEPVALVIDDCSKVEILLKQAQVCSACCEGCLTVQQLCLQQDSA